jgi:NAD(P)-dependent dehydrogenase (short-subunit alcohol dehydrogenase family)
VLPIQLDVTDRATAFAAVQQSAGHFGSLDIVINNAGYGQLGMPATADLVRQVSGAGDRGVPAAAGDLDPMGAGLTGGVR